MARPIRVEYDGAVYHVMARGNEQRAIYYDDVDRRMFLGMLAQTCEQFGLVVHAYCLMPNHYHLVVQTPRANLSQAVGWLQVTYSVRFNRRHQRSGHLFQGRFKAHVVEADAYARRLVLYVHVNPVHPEGKQRPIVSRRRQFLDDFIWSSHKAYSGRCGPKDVPPWLSLEWLSYFGRTRHGAHQKYRRQITDHLRQGAPDLFDAAQGGLVLGSERLWQKVKACVAGSQGREEIAWSRRAGQTERRERVERLLEKETDRRFQIWARVRLAGERSVDVASRYGFRDGSGVRRVVQRLETRAQEDSSIASKLRRLNALAHQGNE